MASVTTRPPDEPASNTRPTETLSPRNALAAAERAFSESHVTHSPVIVRIEPPHGWFDLRLRELWAYRELLYFFIWRDVKVRYKQTVIGVAWVVLQPLLTMGVFTLFFGRLAKRTAPSVVGRVDCGRMANSSPVLAGLVDFAIGFAVLLVVIALYHQRPTAAIVWLPAFLFLALLTALGVGLWMSALNALYRDVRYIVPFLMQFWLFASPVAYPSSLVPARYRWLYGLNPMAGVIEGFRWALTGHGQPPGPQLAASAAAVVLILLGGLLFFQRMEGAIADRV